MKMKKNNPKWFLVGGSIPPLGAKPKSPHLRGVAYGR